MLQFKAGDNCFIAKDYTVHSKIDGIVHFKKNATVHKVLFASLAYIGKHFEYVTMVV